MAEFLNSFVYVVQVCHSGGDGDIPFKSPTISYHLNDASYYFVYFDHRLWFLFEKANEQEFF